MEQYFDGKSKVYFKKTNCNLIIYYNHKFIYHSMIYNILFN